jgi:arginine decarboxylase
VGANHRERPLLEASAEYHRLDRYGFFPPGPPAATGSGPRAREVWAGIHSGRMLASAGLDGRSSSGGYLKRAEQLTADGLGANHASFSTGGSSLSVKAAILAVAGGGGGDLLVSRDAHKSVVAGLIFSACNRGGTVHGGTTSSVWPIHRRPSGFGRRGTVAPTPPAP